jgi:phenylpropionate dioxygenase-like ring-hydroxylating dioxygenase large terminal subunit
MDQKLRDHYQRRVRYTKLRKDTPVGFPDFPMFSAERYFDPEFYELEQTHVFRKTWLLAGHRDEIAERGSYKTWDKAGLPVILFHGNDGEIRAFYNVCRHRGAIIGTEEYGRARTLACAYHGWIYDNQGNLVSIRDQKDFPGFDKSCYSMTPIRMEMLGNMIFVNFDDDAPTLREFFGPVYDDFMEMFAFDVTNVVKHVAWPAPCNWKLLIEGGLENYHGKCIHKTTLAFGSEDQGVITLYPNGIGRDAFLIQKPKDGNTMGGFNKTTDAEANIVEDPRPRNPRIDQFIAEQNYFYGVFPNMNFGTFTPAGFAISCYWPTGLETSEQEFYVIGYGDPKPHEVLWERDFKQAREVLAEDLDFIHRVQQGIKGSVGVKLGYQESRLYHLQQAIDEKIGAEKIRPALRMEPVITPEWIHPNDVARYDADMDRVEAQAQAAE